ncbi:short-chain dehydrogenase/reductase-like protein [Fusarium oxysporum f. sp. albedinis]|nr:short-chain dehydrogenase/reductase-like protein [Fusarium oxysporum f. sp. albedinis]KAJ0136583.1 37S ribosomal protein mrp4 [Fusarium oxysporum f. sp. albedinis]KAK2474712.1 hypothetical protein H9L39_14672 [Fusarium oxysporum f. sp. albedinis]
MTSRYAQVHESPAGPGDARPTASQIIQDEGLEGKWQDKVILITGCSSGLGVETARTLATTGASLYLTARDLNKARSALGDLAQSDRVHLLQLDLNSLASVRACVAEFTSKSSKLNVLIANAGVMMTPEGRTADGFETQFGTNHLAHFLLFQLLKPALLASSTADFNSRVVILSSIAHRSAEVDFDNLNLDGDYNPWVAYGQSKTANVWTANQIERLYGRNGLHAWSVQPGPTGTGLYKHMSEAEVAASQSDPTLAKIFKTVEQGASATVWATTSKALEGQGGKYLEDCQISKPWDSAAGPWAPGYGSWTYDDEKEAKLWTKSLELVGMKQ